MCETLSVSSYFTATTVALSIHQFQGMRPLLGDNFVLSTSTSIEVGGHDWHCFLVAIGDAFRFQITYQYV